MKDIERALLDIAEVRDRLALTQRFKGYSGIAAAMSGALAIIAGVVQAHLVPSPIDLRGGRIYFAIWLICCAASIIINYGAIAHWYVSDVSARDRWQTRTVGLSILPALVLGGALSFALLLDGHVHYLPGVWYGAYGVGMLASRTLIPRAALPLAIGFLLAGIALLFAPIETALDWWVMPAGFGAGQLLLGALIYKERNAQ